MGLQYLIAYGEIECLVILRRNGMGIQYRIGYNTVSPTILYRLRRNGMFGYTTAKLNVWLYYGEMEWGLYYGEMEWGLKGEKMRGGAQAISYYPFIIYQQNLHVAQKISSLIQLMDKLQPGKSLIPYGS